MDDRHANAAGIRESSRQFGERKKEQTVEVRRIARFEGEDRRRDPLLDEFAIDCKARRDADQRAHKDVTRIVDAKEDPRQRGERCKDAEEKAPPPRYQPETRRDRKEISRIVARETAPVLKICVPFEGRRIGSNAVHRTIAIWQ